MNTMSEEENSWCLSPTRDDLLFTRENYRYFDSVKQIITKKMKTIITTSLLLLLGNT